MLYLDRAIQNLIDNFNASLSLYVQVVVGFHHEDSSCRLRLVEQIQLLEAESDWDELQGSLGGRTELTAVGRHLVDGLDRRSALQTWLFAVLDEDKAPDNIHKLIKEISNEHKCA